mmetsp:Transcript_71881/g.120535  ORF Transcript_71881/g.120535 Transcript_71881/m.120535 type:complete len:203 (-) Transcript_71881:1156-1764(-)
MPGLTQGVGVAQQPNAVLGRQLRHIGAEALHHFGRVAHAHGHMLPIVQLDPRRSCGRQLHRHLLVLAERNIRQFGGLDIAAHQERNHPLHLLIASFHRPIRQEPALFNLHGTISTRKRILHNLQHRKAHLGCPTCDQFPNWLPRCLCPSLCQVFSLRVAVRMTIEIHLQPLPEVFIAQNSKKHPHDTASFAVGDGIKNLLDL